MSARRRIQIGDDEWDFAYAIGDTVYLRVRDEAQRGLVTGYLVRPGVVLYAVAWGDTRETNHYDFELSMEHEPNFGAPKRED